jgi:hypothetical protein
MSMPPNRLFRACRAMPITTRWCCHQVYSRSRIACAMNVHEHSNMLSPQCERSMSVIMSELAIFEVRITTRETGSILRAPTERELATKAETLIRRVHARGELIGFRVKGPSTAAIGRIKVYLEDVMVEVAQGSI